MDTIAPGSEVKVTIVKTPTNESARKTLVRLLNKDAGWKAEDTRHRRIRKNQYNPGRRGGRLYAGHLVKQFPVTGKTGETGTIKATVDVISDLKSVQRFVEVTAA